MFGQYMSETVINHFLEHPEKLQFGANAAGSPCFSRISPLHRHLRAPRPETVVYLQNDYLSHMTKIILDEAGTVNKFEGDAIIAFSAPLDEADRPPGLPSRPEAAGGPQELNAGLPDSTCRPCPCASACTPATPSSATWVRPAFDCTVISDTVNLASRHEGVNGSRLPHHGQ